MQASLKYERRTDMLFTGTVALAVAGLMVLALLVTSVVQAAEIPVSKADPAQLGVDSADEAATSALEASARLSCLVEFAGAVYLKDGKYFYTVPVSSGSAKHVAGYRIAISSSAQLVAIYHTHPMNLGGDNSEFFSSADIATATQMHVTSYVGVVKTRSVIRFRPGIDPTLRLGMGITAAAGHAIATFKAST